MLKGLVSLLIGLMMTTVGVDITLGFPRFTFEITDFLNGFTFIPAMIGMFGVSEVMRNVSTEDSGAVLRSVCERISKSCFGSHGTLRNVSEGEIRPTTDRRDPE